MSNTSLVVDQQTMKEHFIAIRYVHGSGGHFLNAWLTASKLNIPNITLGDYGSAHASFKEFGSYTKPPALPAPHFEITSYPPYFVHTEYRDLNVISNSFYKVINIVYELADCDELELSFLGKYYLEKVVNKIPVYLKQHTHRQKYYKQTLDTDYILNVQWKDLLYGDPILLSEKLKTFTGLTNIKIEPLIEWREKTKSSMKETKTKVVMHKDTVEL
jgi:hypothetical protein